MSADAYFIEKKRIIDNINTNNSLISRLLSHLYLAIIYPV